MAFLVFFYNFSGNITIFLLCISIPIGLLGTAKSRIAQFPIYFLHNASKSLYYYKILNKTEEKKVIYCVKFVTIYNRTQTTQVPDGPLRSLRNRR